MKWVGCPSVRPSFHPSVKNSAFSISSLITWPTKLKLCKMLRDIGAHSRSVPDFATTTHGAL